MNTPRDERSIQDLLAESRRLSAQAEQIRRQMDAVTEEIAKWANEIARRAESSGPPEQKSQIEAPPAPPFVGRNLNHSEQEKFDRMARMLGEVFTGGGYPDVLVCEGKGDGEKRVIRFLRGTTGSVLISVKAIEFRACTSDELQKIIEKLLAALKKN